MGGASSNLRKLLSEEAARVRGERGEGADPALTLGEMIKFEVPGGFADEVRVVHPAVLWTLDRDKKGGFSDEDLHVFANEMGIYTNMWTRNEWRDMIVAKCYMTLHDDVLRPAPDLLLGESSESDDDEKEWDGVTVEDSSRGVPRDLESYREWVVELMRRDHPVVRHPKYPDVEYAHVDAVHDLFLMFDVAQSTQFAGHEPEGAEFQTFLDVLQQRGEEMGLLDLELEELDDAVPMDVIREFVEGHATGYRSINVHVGTK